MARWLGVVAGIVTFATGAAAFDLSKHAVPPEEILSGGPPKDGIPAIDDPRFVPADEATFLSDEDRVIGVEIDGTPKAYPLRVLNWHEAVNDRSGGQPFVVTYCPLTGSGIVFDRRIDGKEQRFGISGRLYQSNVLLYDRETESLWSQLGERAVAGERAGATLAELPSVATTWGAWRERHPDSLVLSTETGHARPYGRNPYAGYESSDEILFPVGHVDRTRPPKEWVVGLELEGEAIALPASELEKTKGPVSLQLSRNDVTVTFDPSTRTASARNGEDEVPVFTGYWFAWYAFHPETRVWTAASAPAHSEGTSLDVEIVSQEGRWSSLTGVPIGNAGSTLEDGGGTFYLVTGRLRNVGERPVDSVRLVYELLGDQGDVVFRETGFNRRAESLRDTPEAPIDPIEPRGEDSFRMFFFRDEVPRFEGYRVRIAETHEPRG